MYESDAETDRDRTDWRTPGVRSAGHDSGASIAPGTQVLALVDAAVDPLAALPSVAYRDLLVVSTRQHPGRIETTLRRIGSTPSNVSVVPVSATAVEYDGPLWTTEPVRPADLTGIGIRVNQAMERLSPGSGWVLLDALTLLLMYAEPARIHRFTNVLANNLAARNLRGVYCLSPNAVEDRVVERFRTLCDAQIELEG